MGKIRTRYAPSPTGYFHVGGARTALFNYLYAKHNNGDFIVRIEDTDIERNVENGIDSQLDNLNWLGIKIDESIRKPGDYGPYIQSEKLERYKTLAHQLVNKGKAYYCFCSKEELERNRAQSLSSGSTPKYNRHCLYLSQEEITQKLKDNIPHVIRLKMKDNIEIEWDDLIRGKITIPTSSLTDPTILKSNGIAMYNFAVVIDDHDMNISHVIRGEEHISNTPYQIAIKRALGFDLKEIKYGHLSVIVNEQGKKLSKRDKTLKQFIQDYQDMGFYPHAVTNFLALLGWAPPKKEIMSMQEMINDFELLTVSKAPTFFDFKKMMWVSNEYFKKMDEYEYLKFVDKYININFGELISRKRDILLLFKNQISYASQLNELVTETLLSFSLFKLNEETMNLVNSERWLQTISSFKKFISESNNEISFDQAKEIISKVKQETFNNGKDLFMPIRISITSIEHGPELNKIISILGKQEILKRLKNERN